MSAARARRASAQRVDYGKEQDFSDVDLFEDSEEEAPPPTKRRARKSKGTGVRTSVVATSAPDDGEEDEYDSRPVYTEKGYDPSLPPIRDRFPFLPEYEEDGSPRIELIVGRRPVDEKEDAQDDDDLDAADNEESDGEGTKPLRRRTKNGKKKVASPSMKSSSNGEQAEELVEYEYLVKYKGRSYLHLEWKTGADLESMNKSAKGIYRRYVKKVHAGVEEDIENPDFDPNYVVPERILDEADQEISIELSDKELLRWEKEREKELAEESDDSESKKGDEKPEEAAAEVEGHKDKVDAKVDDADDLYDFLEDDEIDFNKLTLEKLKAIVAREDPYYVKVEGSDNPYRDGYVTEPPKKPRASYIFFQCTLRSYFQRKNPNSIQAEIMSIVAEKWRSMTDEQKEPFLQMAHEEARQYEKEKVLLAKAQKPNEVWQPLRRCLMVLERLRKDSFADIFLEPVDTQDFPDYEDIIDSPMDLATVRSKILDKKYQVPEQFARDMRKVWNNCKIYNQHGSAIWHVADYMSKLFERLYHAWVLEFRERYLRWKDPRARPWEHTCRCHDGSCETPDDQMVLCDHCDAMYGFKCVKPQLKKAPSKAWHCPECKPKLKSAKGIRMLSAVAENAARKRAELGDIPMKKMKQSMFLVKWKNLGYEFCTWETRADVNDDKLISDFRKLNSSHADETEVEAQAVVKTLSATNHVIEENAGGQGCTPLLRSQLYAQTRTFEFLKFGSACPPPSLTAECGPQAKAFLVNSALSNATPNSKGLVHPGDVVACVTDLVFRVARKELESQKSFGFLPPLMNGEYDAIIPITAKGLMMNVGEINGSVAFLGYRPFPDGSKGPAEVKKLVRSVGDKIIAVDGVSTIGKSFKDVIGMLKESGKNKFAYMRFLESRLSGCDSHLVSSGDKGRYAIEEMRTKFITDRQRIVLQRQQIVENMANEADHLGDVESASERGDSDSDSEDGGSEGEFEPDSEDEEMAQNSSEKADVSAEAATDVPSGGGTPQDNEKSSKELVSGENGDDGKSIPLHGIAHTEETTQSLAFRLLDLDVGYSSDEGGTEDRAYFLDGVDQTFAAAKAIDALFAGENAKKIKRDEQVENASLPARQTEFSTLGDRAKLAAAVLISPHQPDEVVFDSFLLKSKDSSLESGVNDTSDTPTKVIKRSTVKVEQVSVSTGDVLHVWANVEAAAATLQLPLQDLRQVLLDEYDEDIGDEVGGYKWRYAPAGAKVTAGAAPTSRGGGGKKAQEAWLEFRDKLYDPNEPHVYKNGNRLRDYQIDGVNWLSSVWYKRQGCILADEMGLGKTVQIVCFIDHLFRVEKIRRPFLVVVPLSTVEHWRREFEGWTDMVCCIYHDRQRVWRDVLREYEWYFEDRPHTPEYLKFDVLVTTYDTLIGDFDIISGIPFRVAVVDEAHRLRNQKGKLLECMREISARGTMQYGFQSRVLMSGTPLQNDLTELWTLLNFIEPYKFPELEDFQSRFGNMANQEQVQNLQQMISPYMLRRVKDDVAKDIPAKEETVIDVELTSLQKQYYRAIFEHNHAFLSIGINRQVTPKLMNIQMELRKACNHPFLLDGVEHRELDRVYREFSEKGVFEGKTPEEQQHMVNEQGYVMSSGKMVLLDKLLPKLRQEGHKVLIFSQMVKMLDLISEYCEFRDFRYERLDGRVRGTERQKAIDRFERESDSFLFLLSTRAGGVGINLTAADVCIIFDSDWNPQNDVQAQARCHRIGQTRDVRIYRLVTSRSFEQEMFDRASKKLGLEQAVLGTFEKDRDDDKPTQQEMEQLLKRGAYALLDDENDEITKEFCADDIESILAKRTRTRVVEGAKTASWLNKQGMVISKSKFSAEAGGDTLDMDDPEFWQKVMPNFVTPGLMMQKFKELQDEVDGKVRGPGRGRKRRGRPRKNAIEDEVNEAEEGADATKAANTINAPTADAEDVNADARPDKEENDSDSQGDGEEDGSKNTKDKFQLSRTHVKKILKFMSDLKGMMEGLFEDDEDDMNPADKDICQKLLLTISIKERLFSEEQRHQARTYLKRLEGDRRRRCRVPEQNRFQPGVKEEEVDDVIQELRIEGKKRKKRRKRNEFGELEELTPERPKNRRLSENGGGGYLGDDGYLHHSDSGEDWSDVAEDFYDARISKKDRISAKEARRRRQWLAGDDDATAAGRAWPVFPRHMVSKILRTVLDEMIKHDDSRGGTFSEPVSKEDFPDYYEQIENPMDYSTMKKKLENGEYRSAQAMQKDFILILQNCRKYNDKKSDIVKEAFDQHVIRPKLLLDAALKHGLFIAEDGSILEIIEEAKPGSTKKGRKRRSVDGEGRGQEKKTPKQKRATKDADESSIEANATKKESKKNAEKPGKGRIRISLEGVSPAKGKKGGKRKRSLEVSEDGNDEGSNDADETKVAKKRAKGQRKSSLDGKVQGIKGSKKASTDDTAFDLVALKKRRESLDGTFKKARKNLTQLGPWKLPEKIQEKFQDVALGVLSKMNNHDRYDVFTEPVSDDQAPGYSEVVENPMDFGSMRQKVETGKYGTGSDAAAALFEDFLLVFDNCSLYNPDDSEVAEEAARVLGLLPEAFAAAVAAVLSKTK